MGVGNGGWVNKGPFTIAAHDGRTNQDVIAFDETTMYQDNNNFIAS